VTVRVVQSHNERRLAGTRDSLDIGIANGGIQIRSGSKPTNVGDVATGTLLAAFELTKPCGTIASNVLTLTVVSDAIILASGTPGYARWVDGDGNVVMDTDVSLPSGSAEVRLSSMTLTADSLVTLLSAQLG
jgi:hypothetical protein